MKKARVLIGCSAVVALSSLSMAAELTSSAKPVTFTKDIAPIFQEKCESCHRPGTSAPMSLQTYEVSRPWAKAIKSKVASRTMPPWHLDKTVGIQSFQNDRSLSDDQIATIVKWVDEGAVKGDPKDMPVAKVWPSEDGWQLAKQFGEPEIIIKSSDYTMPAQHQDVWWKPLTAVPITEERWVKAVEMRPSSVAGRKITHHSVASLHYDDQPDVDPNADDSAVMGDGLLMEWAIGKVGDTYRADAGKLIKPGAQVRWDIHYHASGEMTTDHQELALYLYPKGVVPKHKTILTNFGAQNRADGGIDIPPNTVKVTQAFHVLKAPARIENFQPHMHLRGKAMSMEAILPNGTTRLLSYVNNFNFNWMNSYIYTDDAAPVLPKGTIIHITAWHDNTAANPNNPDPNQWIGGGDRTVDEMAHAWVNVTYISDEEYKDYEAAHKTEKPVSARRGQ